MLRVLEERTESSTDDTSPESSPPPEVTAAVSDSHFTAEGFPSEQASPDDSAEQEQVQAGEDRQKSEGSEGEEEDTGGYQASPEVDPEDIEVMVCTVESALSNHSKF